MKARMLLILCISITVLGANSVFSFDGMAEQNTGADVYGKGMGETGSADLFRINQSTSNPSLMVSANKVFLHRAFPWETCGMKIRLAKPIGMTVFIFPTSV